MEQDTVSDNWVKFVLMLALILVLPGLWALLPLLILVTLK
jgi:hypothetical protein